MVTISIAEPASAPASRLHWMCWSQGRGALSSSQSTGTASANRSSFSSSEPLHTFRAADVMNIQASGSSSATAMGHKARKSMGS